MARTRASKGNDTAAKAGNSTAAKPASKSRYPLATQSENPPKIFILPKKATDEARIVLLLHPRYAKPTRYLVCPETGFYEFTRIAAPKSAPRSWLIETGSHNPEQTSPAPDPAEKDATFNTYVTNGADLFVATPIDPLFLILPTLIDPSGKSEKRRYISSDDHFDRIQEESPHLWEILRWGGGRVRNLLEARLGAVCDMVETGDERVFQFSEDKLVGEIVGKARRMSTRPLPQSMEEKFVVRPLEAPVLGIIRREATTTATTTTTTVTSETKESAETTQDDSSVLESTNETPKPQVEASETQSSVSSTDTGTNATSETQATTVSVVTAEEESKERTDLLLPAMIASPEITSLQRLRTAFHFLCSGYVPPSLATMLRAKIAAHPGVDFESLDTYLSELNHLKEEAIAARAAVDYSRKRVLDEDELAERAEKKRKKEEDEKRKKAGESRGVKQLKKVNTAGMKKMSDFFTKKT